MGNRSLEAQGSVDETLSLSLQQTANIVSHEKSCHQALASTSKSTPQFDTLNVPVRTSRSSLESISRSAGNAIVENTHQNGAKSSTNRLNSNNLRERESFGLKKVQFSPKEPVHHVYEAVDNFALTHPRSDSSNSFLDVDSEASEVSNRREGTFSYTCNPISSGNASIEQGHDIGQARLFSSSAPRKSDVSIFKTTKQCVDAEVCRLKEDHPVFREKAMQELHREKESLGRNRGLMRNMKSKPAYNVSDYAAPAAGSRSITNIAGGSGSSFRDNAPPRDASMVKTNAIHSRVIQTEHDFTRPLYLQTRDKHYSGSGVADLLGRGLSNGYHGTSSSYATRTSEGTFSAFNQIGRNEIKNICGRR